MFRIRNQKLGFFDFDLHFNSIEFYNRFILFIFLEQFKSFALIIRFMLKYRFNKIFEFLFYLVGSINFTDFIIKQLSRILLNNQIKIFR